MQSIQQLIWDDRGTGADTDVALWANLHQSLPIELLQEALWGLMHYKYSYSGGS